jgi:hypothetical protein
MQSQFFSSELNVLTTDELFGQNPPLQHRFSFSDSFSSGFDVESEVLFGPYQQAQGIIFHDASSALHQEQQIEPYVPNSPSFLIGSNFRVQLKPDQERNERTIQDIVDGLTELLNHTPDIDSKFIPSECTWKCSDQDKTQFEVHVYRTQTPGLYIIEINRIQGDRRTFFDYFDKIRVFFESNFDTILPLPFVFKLE